MLGQDLSAERYGLGARVGAIPAHGVLVAVLPTRSLTGPASLHGEADGARQVR